MLESLRSFDESPRHGGEVQLSRQAALARIGMAGRLTALGENRLLDEVEPVGEFDLFWNGTSTDPSPDFAENRTLRCEEHFEVKTAVIRGQGILQNRPGQSQDRLCLLAFLGEHHGTHVSATEEVKMRVDVNRSGSQDYAAATTHAVDPILLAGLERLDQPRGRPSLVAERTGAQEAAQSLRIVEHGHA